MAENKELLSSLSSFDRQVGGGHYKDYVIQPLEFCVKNNIPFLEGNVIKYICRWRKKNGVQDLEKAKHYIEMLIELEKANDDAIKWTDKQVQDLSGRSYTDHNVLGGVQVGRYPPEVSTSAAVPFVAEDY